MSSNNANVVEARERCPECAKKGKDTRGDNLAVYGDGHKHCFSCGYRESSEAVKMVEAIVKQAANDDEENSKIVKLPFDANKTIDAVALTWLANFGITREEIIENDIRWSPTRHALIFPIRDVNGSLKAWQRRNFSPNDRAKWITYGDVKDHVHIINNMKYQGSPIVLVEDIVSAIKVGRHARAVPLFGSNVSLRLILRLKYLTKRLIFWLDADKYADSILFAKRAEAIGIETRVVYTSQDPKACNDQTIINMVTL